MKTKHNILAMFLIGLVYCLSVGMQQPVSHPAFTSTSTQTTKIQSQRQLTNPLFFESQNPEVVFTLENLGVFSQGKVFTYTALAPTHGYHGQVTKTSYAISTEHVLKTRKVDLLYPSHFFW